ncbi:hypothetical protein CGCSCA4_v012644 [Colletotrichum siamense]|uniref:SnoaL-like domain-containing protein n=1 Tax=Colletotrichum siamense TaxID=690259 RepID=A0A9P5EJX6_COLSI|nr:hypothetical protein CGCSCA4_v012644 [Colletotrichum siamense]KAF4848315.1 hypothetical protein CGCSCA2_v012348 [Colletotrichum siamense]
MRPAIEQMVRQFFRAIENDERDSDIIMDFFSDRPTMIISLKGPGWIWTGQKEVKQQFEIAIEAHSGFRVLPKMIVVDRGHVTCHVVIFLFGTGDFDSFTELQRISIFDLDKNNRIQRLEYRDVAGTEKQRKGGRQVLDALITEIEEGALAVDYLS